MRRYLVLNRWAALGLALLVLGAIALMFREGGAHEQLQQLTRQIATQNRSAPAPASEAAPVIEIDAVEEEQAEAEAEVAGPAKAEDGAEPDEDTYDSYIILDDGAEVQEVADEELR